MCVCELVVPAERWDIFGARAIKYISLLVGRLMHFVTEEISMPPSRIHAYPLATRRRMLYSLSRHALVHCGLATGPISCSQATDEGPRRSCTRLFARRTMRHHQLARKSFSTFIVFVDEISDVGSTCRFPRSIDMHYACEKIRTNHGWWGTISLVVLVFQHFSNFKWLQLPPQPLLLAIYCSLSSRHHKAYVVSTSVRNPHCLRISALLLIVSSIERLEN